MPQMSWARLYIVVLVGVVFTPCLLGQLSSGGLRLKPTKTYLRAMNASLAAEDRLNVCRAAAARAGEHLVDLACFQEAVRSFEWNATWSKQLAALAMMTAQRRLAYTYFNRSAQITLEAQAFVNVTDAPPFDPEILLKLYYRREREGAVELAKVWAQCLQMDQQLNTAAVVLEQFVVPLNHLSEALMVYRNMGNIVKAAELHFENKRIDEMRSYEIKKRKAKNVKPKLKSKYSKVVLLAEEVGTSAEQMVMQWLSSKLTATPAGRLEANEHSKKVCGLQVPLQDEYTLNEVVMYLSACVAKWGDLQRFLDQEKDQLPRQYGAILRTVAHHLAAFNAGYLLRKVLESDRSLLTKRDNFGRTPLHQAVAHRQSRTIELIVEIGGTQLLQEKDAGSITPLKMACRTPRFREEFETLSLGLPPPEPGRSICGEFGQSDRVHEEASEDFDEMFASGGGWTNASSEKFDSEACDFDIRTGDSMSHHELLGRYVHSSAPVVLRGALPKRLRDTLSKAAFLRQFGHVLLRREIYPTSEHFGVPITTIQNASAFAKNASRNFGTIEMSDQHPLFSSLSWVPARLFPPQQSHDDDDDAVGERPKDEGYITLGDAYPLLVVGGAHSRTNAVVRAQHFFFANVFGIQDWRLQAPPQAFTTRERATFTSPPTPETLRCRLQSGDVLVVPMLWSAAWRNRGESIGFLTRFVWK